MTAQQTAVATLPQRNSLVTKFAAKYSIDADKLLPILKATAFKVRDGEATNEQMAALLVVADQYGLNPFTREIFAFPDKQNGIVPVVGVDGWSRIINDHEQSDGLEFRQSEDMTTMPGGAQECPKWMEVVIYRKDRAHPIVVREYLDEVYRAPFREGMKGPWQSHTKRFLRHKTLIQGARIAYGFTGIYDEDEAERIIEHDITPPPTNTPASGAARLKSAVVTEPAKAVAAEEPAAAAPDTGHPGVTFDTLKGRIEKATDVDMLDADADLIGTLASVAEQDTLRNLYNSKRTALLTPPPKK